MSTNYQTFIIDNHFCVPIIIINAAGDMLSGGAINKIRFLIRNSDNFVAPKMSLICIIGWFTLSFDAFKKKDYDVSTTEVSFMC